MALDVVIMAGGPLPDALREFADRDYKGLLKFGERTMVEMVVDMIREVEGIGKVVCVGPVEIMNPVLGDRVDEHVQSGEKMIETLRRGIDALEGAEEVLICTCDIPLVTAEMVEDFIGTCREAEADVYYPMVERSLNEKKYPGMKRTYLKLREGTYTGGNIVLLKPEVLRRQWGTIEQIMALRKSPVKLLGLIGFVFILKFLFKMLSARELEKKVESIVGCRVKAVEVKHPEIGIDVDKESDYLLVKKALGL